MTEQTKIEFNAQQVIPDTNDVNVANIAVALEITKMVSSSIIYDETSAEDRARKLAQIFRIVKKELTATG